MTTSEHINELAAALAKAQSAIKGAVKDSANPFFKSQYADLASVWDACRTPLAAHGLAVVQSPSLDNGVVSVTTLLMHQSGQWVRGVVSATPKDDGPQAIGSVVTYLRRYALQSMVGVAPEDDDAESAERRGKTTSAPQKVLTMPPAGFEDWLTDLTAVADEGTAALEKAWKHSKPEYRKHLVESDPKRWDRLKQHAATLQTELA